MPPALLAADPLADLIVAACHMIGVRAAVPA